MARGPLLHEYSCNIGEIRNPDLNKKVTTGNGGYSWGVNVKGNQNGASVFFCLWVIPSDV
jgi:hypothetical protein